MRKNNFVLAVVLIVLVQIIEIIFILNLTKNRLFTRYEIEFNDQRELALRKVSEGIVDHHRDVIEKLQITAKMTEVKNGSTDCNDKLKELFPLFEEKSDTLIRMNNQGIIDCAFDKGLLGVDLDKTLPHIDEILNEETHPIVIGHKRVSPASGKEVVGVHVPIFDGNGNFSHTLASAIYLDETKERFLKDMSHSYNSQILLIDDNREILYQFRPINKELLSLIYEKIGKKDNGYSEVIYKGEKLTLFYRSINILPGREYTLIELDSFDKIVSDLTTKSSFISGLRLITIASVTVIFSLITGASLTIYFCLKNRPR
jgi:hypothetical protein